MNNIEILEDLTNHIRFNEPLHYGIGLYIQAMENLIQENKELKKPRLLYNSSSDTFTSIKELDSNFIKKSKIIDFINKELPDDEICKYCSNFDVNGIDIKNKLKSLLEEE